MGTCYGQIFFVFHSADDDISDDMQTGIWTISSKNTCTMPTGHNSWL